MLWEPLLLLMLFLALVEKICLWFQWDFFWWIQQKVVYWEKGKYWVCLTYTIIRIYFCLLNESLCFPHLNREVALSM